MPNPEILNLYYILPGMSDDLIQVQRNTDDRSISDLLGELYRDALQVISLEIEFAKTEMS